jgi:Raf kinase inhibitor-like YbhB/YbcL family protein
MPLPSITQCWEELLLAFSIGSPAFKNGGNIPEKYTADGEDISPQIIWSDPPRGTRSFALICDDPDAPMGTWTHWMIYDIPGDRMELPENFPKVKDLPDGAKQGLNTWKRVGYGGPDPPAGKPHRYIFRIYALNDTLGISAAADKANLLRIMGNRVLGRAEFIGIYER